MITCFQFTAPAKSDIFKKLWKIRKRDVREMPHTSLKQHTEFREEDRDPGRVLEEVYKNLSDRGYDPVEQLTGYLLSGDPTYITNYKGARSVITRVARDEILEELLRSYAEEYFAG